MAFTECLRTQQGNLLFTGIALCVRFYICIEGQVLFASRTTI